MTEWNKRPLGPNAKKLIAHKMSIDAIPAGGGFEAGIRFLSSKESILSGARHATQWVLAAIDAVRGAAEPNQWKSASDEEIAGELLLKIDERKKHALRKRT